MRPVSPGGSPYPGPPSKGHSDERRHRTAHRRHPELERELDKFTGYEVCVDTVADGLCDTTWDPVSTCMSTVGQRAQ